MANADSKARRLESLESMILHPSTNENECKAAIGRWEAITGEKWSGKPRHASNPNTSRSTNTNRQQQQRSQRSSSSGGFNWDDFADAFRRASHGSGFTGFTDDDDYSSYADPRRSNPNWGKRGYQDFSHNECTQKQYDFVRIISDFFRWKCPDKHQVEFEEAQDFLNRYAELFKAFSPYSRNFKTLKALFEAFGIDWNQTKRTFKWKAFHER